MRQGVNMRVNLKELGDCFGEVSLMYSCPRNATVAATTDAVVWVLERDVFRWAQQRLTHAAHRPVYAALCLMPDAFRLPFWCLWRCVARVAEDHGPGSSACIGAG